MSVIVKTQSGVMVGVLGEQTFGLGDDGFR